ncbi:MAG TPA: hypothetical protein VME24_12410 [Alphaproteobacteria bacterium]|nr:hypothetical protein [Alphaproteobacteria bacterium]
MRTAILKQIAFENLFALGMVCLASYILWVSLKAGVAFGKWPRQVCRKNESPVFYWICVACYAFFFGCSIFVLVLVIKGDILAYHWPALPN